MGELKLINGKFMRDGVEVKAEFGNKEQIRLLEWANKLKSEHTVIGKVSFEETITYQPIVEFKCPMCGKDNKCDDFEASEDWSPDNSDIDDCVVECEHCAAEFVTTIEGVEKKNEIKIILDR